ncbi:homocysteine S-methyltransferase family protein [bacterium]|nr:homocysteine S-methyltransferase family protein [bacterium]
MEFKELLEKQVIIIDGAMGTMTQAHEFDATVYGGAEFQMLSDILVFSRPQTIEAIHVQFFEAGANAVETNTLCSSVMRLSEHDFSEIDLSEFPLLENGKDLRSATIEEISYYLNKQAARISRNALEMYKKSANYDNRPLFVLGSLGPSNWVLSSTQADLKKGEFDQIELNFHDQALGLIDGGVDVLLFETQQDVLELKAAIIGAKRALRERGIELPIMAQVTVDANARMQIFNTDIQAALTTLQDIGIDAFGINCGLGPDQMLLAVEKLSRYSKIPISIIPNAGLPCSEHGKTVFKMTSELFAGNLKLFVEKYGVNIVGGCCGTTPEHIKALSKAVGKPKPKSRTIDKTVHISGPQQAVRLDGSESLIRIGERLNVRGSKKVREAVENSSPINQEILEEVVLEQTRDLGIEIIDVCMDSNVVDTTTALSEVIQSQTVDFSGAMSLDSFDVKALEEAVKKYPGRPIINSISLEEFSPGISKVEAVLKVTKDHAPIYIALTTGPEGPATTAEKKVELARQIMNEASTHGVKPDQIMVDINAFPIGSEPEKDLNFALESINAIPGVKGLHKDLKTVIGVGNLTNGLAQKPYMRKVLTSVFLDEARKKGLDAAIINPDHYVPVDSLNVKDYELGRRVILEHDMDAFAELEEIALQKKGMVVKKKTVYEDLDSIAAICAKIMDGHKERSEGSLEIDDFSYQYQDKIVLRVVEVINEIEPLALINDHLMPAMEELGAGFAAGTISLPHLLKSADVMKQVMMFLEAYLKKTTKKGSGQEIGAKGTIVVGTVYQDVHSIGKDLSKTLMENYGYTVIDLGVQVPLQKFIDVAKEHKAIAIGLSALLVQTSNHMITLSSMLKEENMESIPLLIGGAPINQRHAAFVAMAGGENEGEMRDNVFYCRSGMDGVNYLSQLQNEAQRKQLLENNRKTLVQAYHSGLRLKKEKETLFKTLPRRKVSFDSLIHETDNAGLIEKIEYSMKEFLPHLKESLLFTLNWKYGGKGTWEKKGVNLESLRNTLNEWIVKIDQENWIRPQAVHALFPCKGFQNSVVVLNPETGNELGRLTFNDIIGEGKKDIFSVAEYFNPQRNDYIGLQISTAGVAGAKAIQQFERDDKESMLALQGIADRVAEDMAEHINQILETDLLKTTGLSKRYSPGYPGMIDLKNNRLIASILNAPERLGIQLTDGDEFYPTSTTAAVVCFHPEADYH